MVVSCTRCSKPFKDTQAAQCGYCLNGMVMMTVALLAHNPQPTDAQIRAQLSHNLCRCGSHLEIMAGRAGGSISGTRWHEVAKFS
jgi:aerobic-type carbon monoxide dehydrogenase small subunit (CoxS/CutS family)